MPRNLERHELALVGGVNTQFNPDLVANGFLKEIQNLDTFAVWQGLSKVPGSSAQTVSAGGQVKSLHQFEYSDLLGDRQRKQLVLAGDGVLKVRDGSSALASLLGGLTAERLVACQVGNRIYLSGAGQNTRETGGIKYDGTNARNWGVVAPGQLPVTLERINDDTVWLPATDSAVVESDESINGYGSLEVNKTGATVAYGRIEATGLALDVTANDGSFYLYVHLPDGALQVLEPDTAIRVELGTGGVVDTNVYDVQVGTLVPGWNLISFVSTAYSSQTGAGATLAAVSDVLLSFNLLATTTTLSGVLFNFLHQKVSGTPSAIDTGLAGNVDGSVSYRVTFLTERGVESNAGPASTALSVDEAQVDLISIPVSDDPQVIARRIYRDNAGDAIYRFVAQIDENSSTEFTDNTASSSLGSATAPIAGDDELDSSPPPAFAAVAAHNGRVFGVDASDRTIVWVSDVATPEQFRLIDQLTLNEEMTSLVNTVAGLMFVGRDRWFILSGDGVNEPFDAIELNPELGANSAYSAVRGGGVVWALRERELFIVTDPRDPWYVSGPVQDEFDSFITDPDLAFVLHDRARFRTLVFNGTTSEIWCWQYGTSGRQEVSPDGSGIESKDMRVGSWFKLKLPTAVIPLCAEMVETASETPECWFGASDGFVYKLQDDAEYNYLDAGVERAVNTVWESHPLPLGVSYAGRGDARLIEFRTRSVTGATWSCTVATKTSAAGDDIGSVTFDVAIPVGDAAVVVPIPEGASSGGWASVRMENNRVDEDTTFFGATLYYIPRTALWGPRSS